MKFFVVVLSIFAMAAAAPPVPSAVLEARRLPALEQEEVHDEYGQFALRYVTAEGTIVSERGRLVPNKEGTGYVMVVEGEVSYIGDDGKTYITKYTAGPDGYHVEGNHLPVPVTAEPVVEPAKEIVKDIDLDSPLRMTLTKPAKLVPKPKEEAKPSKAAEPTKAEAKPSH